MDEFAFYIPSAFTPNGDGKNDQFAIMGINYKNFVQKIFTRWGQPVFESVNRNFWDGTDWNGNKAPAGNYVYQIEVFENTGKKHVFNGNVNLIR
jgi:gliding motility-associated-like protein